MKLGAIPFESINTCHTMIKIHNYKYWNIALLCFFAVACSQPAKKDTDATTVCKPTGGETIMNDIYPVDHILCVDSLLYLAQDDDDAMVQVYDDSGNLVASGITIGQGKDDVLEISSVHSGDRKVYLYDSRMGKIHSVSVAGGKLTSAVLCGGLRLFDDAVLLPDSTLLVATVNSNNSYLLIDESGTVTDSLSYFPAKPDGIADETHHLACSGELAYSQTDSTFARILAYDGGIDFFRIFGGHISHTGRHALFDMEYTTLNGDSRLPVPSEDSKVGYLNLCVTPKYYYTSFSGSKISENPDALCDEIHVFDHQGNLQYKIMLENPVVTFCVSRDDRQLFVVENDDEIVSVKKYIMNRSDS